MDNENIIMELIIHAGQSRSCSMEALRAARERQWEKAENLLVEAKESARQAHLIQTQLIGEDEGEGRIKVNLIIVHAQDHLMNAILCRDLVEELIALYREVASLSDKCN
ncbi:PTS lactose/cellobiose transporter subunit IIA [Pectobacterium sp. A5351]|uniref:PTS lactose/cellobiose transporter subunit IIA n=1 Tax=Pectobacterium sp. A5351 TaxID=2914983 RepID=UPI00232E6BAB|nr:PTS lactose/cellobiose transporter subunit IIA [Pectobacterium sp. A5351]WCG81493.1 PTS lactose/cellobiose transporter subunit IIA [Pectobacterium sp. A5351]